MTEVKLDFDKQGGLVPVIVTDYKTGQVLMLAYMNEVSYQLTLETKQMTLLEPILEMSLA